VGDLLLGAGLLIQALATAFIAAIFFGYRGQLDAMRRNLRLSEEQISLSREASQAERVLAIMASLDDIDVRQARRVVLGGSEE